MSEKPTITVTVEGGVIQDVAIPHDLNVQVVVMDFDIEGCSIEEQKKLPRNEEGQQYVRSVW